MLLNPRAPITHCDFDKKKTFRIDKSDVKIFYKILIKNNIIYIFIIKFRTQREKKLIVILV